MLPLILPAMRNRLILAASFAASLALAACNSIAPDEDPQHRAHPDGGPGPGAGRDSGGGPAPRDGEPGDGDSGSNEPSGPAYELLALVNEERAKGANCGGQELEPAPPLVWNALLADAALMHSEDMAKRGYLDHTSPDGHTVSDRLAAVGYSFSTWGENIAMGQTSPQAAMASWMKSPGHCRNIMSADFTEFGAGEYQRYWTQVFGRPR